MLSSLHHSARELVVYTGIEGMEKFNHALWLCNLKDLLDWLVEKEAYTKEQAVNLTQMLDSNDDESVNLAAELINIVLSEQIPESNETDIQSRRSLLHE